MGKKEFGMLSHHWDGTYEQIENWVWTRKYNGWSALWDGGVTRNKMADTVPWYYKGGDKRNVVATGLWTLGRNNKPKVIEAPGYFLDTLPVGVPVHGELWYNDRLDIIKRTCGLKKTYSAMWYSVIFKAFGIKHPSLWDCESLNIGKDYCFPMTYTGSLQFLERFNNETFQTVKYRFIETEDQLKLIQGAAITEGWEGLMFNNPASIYVNERSHNNLKWKPAMETEATVIGYVPGKTGRKIGHVGSLQCEMVWDEKVISVHGGLKSMVGVKTIFAVSGLNDDEIDWTACKELYPVGSKVNFKYLSISTHAVPQSCHLTRVLI